MNIKAFFIERLAILLLSGKVWGRIKHLVERVNDDTGVTGEEKLAWVKYDAKQIGIDIAGHLLNLGIELAVAWLRSQASK